MPVTLAPHASDGGTRNISAEVTPAGRPWISLCCNSQGTKGILPLLKLVIARHRENSPLPRFARHE
jgi:hypothetical protein